MPDARCIIEIVEDDAGVRKAMRRLLRAAGFEANAFGSAEDFLRDLDSGGHYCLILDIKLPGMSGIELHDCLEKKGVHIPTIFITADEMNWERTTNLQSSNPKNVFLLKPVNDTALLGAVEAALSGSA